MGDLKIVTWSMLDEATYLCVYFIQDLSWPNTFDFVTSWETDCRATGSSSDSQIMPGTANQWGQSFNAATAQENWHRHLEAKAFLELKNSNLRSKQPNLEEDFHHSLVSQSNHVRSLLLWPMRIPYWTYVRKYLRHNKSVEQLTSGRKPDLRLLTFSNRVGDAALPSQLAMQVISSQRLLISLRF